MDVIGDLVARDRRSDAVAIRTDSRAGSYSYETCCTNAWKAGNLLRHYGVRGGATVAVDAGDPLSPQPLTAFLGAALLGATVRFDPDESSDVRALVVPAERATAYDAPPGTQLLVYGGQPDGPGVAHFERELWSENPTQPPDSVSADAVALAADGDRHTHEALLSAADRVASAVGLTADDVVAIRAPLAEPGVVVAGVLAPLVVGAAILVDGEQTGTVGVGRSVPEDRRVDPEEVV